MRRTLRCFKGTVLGYSPDGLITVKVSDTASFAGEKVYVGKKYSHRQLDGDAYCWERLTYQMRSIAWKWKQTYCALVSVYY